MTCGPEGNRTPFYSMPWKYTTGVLRAPFQELYYKTSFLMIPQRTYLLYGAHPTIPAVSARALLSPHVWQRRSIVDEYLFLASFESQNSELHRKLNRLY